jgi:hypothetical protein
MMSTKHFLTAVLLVVVVIVVAGDTAIQLTKYRYSSSPSYTYCPALRGKTAIRRKLVSQSFHQTPETKTRRKNGGYHICLYQNHRRCVRSCLLLTEVNRVGYHS